MLGTMQANLLQPLTETDSLQLRYDAIDELLADSDLLVRSGFSGLISANQHCHLFAFVHILDTLQKVG